MTEAPETRYAKAADGVHIAFQTVGEGPIDIVFTSAWWDHLEARWEEPRMAHLLRRMASVGRLILFDKRGTGLSDPVPLSELPTLEQWADDVRVVMDAAGSERAALVGHAGGGQMSMLFAAAHPELTAALVLIDTYARLARDVDYPAGMPAHVLQAFTDRRVDIWGTGAVLDVIAPSVASDPVIRRRVGQHQRLAASPGTALAMQRMLNSVDLRSILTMISVPTLVLHRSGDRFVRPGHGRYLAEHIGGASYVELTGDDHVMWAGDPDALLDEVEEFLTGMRSGADVDRALATVLFTDIVDSTGRLAEIGDRRWRELLDAHDALVGRQVLRHRGRLVKSTGDGALAAFDGPARAIRCACAIRDAVRGLGVEARCGLHAGEVDLRGDDIGGIAVHIGARVGAAARVGEVLVSRTVCDLVAGSGFAFEDRGEHELKGVPGTWRLFAVAG